MVVDLLEEGCDEDVVGVGRIAGNIGTDIRSDNAGAGDATGDYAGCASSD
jgi:hypothetical protein